LPISHKWQANDELTYEKVLKNLSSLKKDKDLLSETQLSEQEQDQINDLFGKAIDLIKQNNQDVNEKDWTLLGSTLLVFAAYFHKHEIIEYLMTNCLEKITEEPIQLCQAIYWTVKNGQDQTLKLLVTKDILEKLWAQSKEFTGLERNNVSKITFKQIKKGLEQYSKGDNEQLNILVAQALATIADIEMGKVNLQPNIPVIISSTANANSATNTKNTQASTSSTTQHSMLPRVGNTNIDNGQPQKTANVTTNNNTIGGTKKSIKPRGKKLTKKISRKTLLIAGGTGTIVAGGTFVGALLAKKGINHLLKDTKLVTNPKIAGSVR
jgi:hypothetical protein